MDAISGISTPPETAAAASADANQDLGQDTFLKLLVAQLRFQDPMSPADSSEFLAQTAQFTQVEKLEEIAAAMSTLTKNDQLATIGNLVGKVVQHRDSLGQIVESTVTSGRIHEDGIVLIADGHEIGMSEVVGVTTSGADDPT